MKNKHRFFVNGKWIDSGEHYELRNPYNNRLIGLVSRAGPQHVEEAIQGAVRAFKITRGYSSAERAEILRKIAAGIGDKRDEFAETISLEAGKCLKQALAEVDRSILTFSIAMEEAKRIGGELLPMDLLPSNRGRTAIVRRFPIGPISGISPFNFPLNLVAHKLAPALAMGNTMVLKPASQTPLTALMLAEIVEKSGLVQGGFSVLTVSSKHAAPLVEDPRLKKISFTGSPEVGWEMKKRCGSKRITLELGGNAAAIVHEDADLKRVLERCMIGAFAYQGQICIHLQRLMIQEKIYGRLKKSLVREVKKLKIGDPLNPGTDIGPMIDIKEAKRVEEWILEARAAGAKILCGGRRKGTIVEPTVIEKCDPRLKVSDQEVFGPVLILRPYMDFNEALDMVNDSTFGLQAGVFTNDVNKIWKAYNELDVGGVVINDVPTFRTDMQPYGGIKNSGFGREGIRYAMEEMSEIKILSLHFPD